MYKRVWRIYGEEGHRQKQSFEKSYRRDFSNGSDIRIINVKNSDVTGTHEYTEIEIIRNNHNECEYELNGQISDGIFEHCKVGNVVELQDQACEIKVWKVYSECCHNSTPIEDVTWNWRYYADNIIKHKWNNDFGNKIDISDDFSEKFIDDVYNCYMQEQYRELWEIGSMTNGEYQILILDADQEPSRPSCL